MRAVMLEAPEELLADRRRKGLDRMDEMWNGEQKLPFYAALGIREVWIVDPETRALQLFVLCGNTLLPLQPNSSGSLHSQILGVTFATLAGPKLKLTWPGGETEI